MRVRTTGSSLSPSATSTACRRACQSEAGGCPIWVTDTGNSCTDIGAMPQVEKMADTRGPTAGSVLSPRAARTAPKNRWASANAWAPARGAVPIARGVVGFDREDAAARPCDAGQLAHGQRHVVDVLQHRHAEGRIEGTGGEREPRHIGARQLQAIVVRPAFGGSGATRARLRSIANSASCETRSRPSAQFGRALAAPHIEDAIAGTRAQGLLKEPREGGVPPLLAEVLERRRCQRIDVTSHDSSIGRPRSFRRGPVQSWQPVTVWSDHSATGESPVMGAQKAPRTAGNPVWTLGVSHQIPRPSWAC